MTAPSQDAVGMLSARSPDRLLISFTCSSGRSHKMSISPACNAAILYADFGNDAQFDAGNFWQASIEVIGIARHHHAIARRVADKFECPGADRLCRHLGDRTARGDLHLAVRHDIGKAAIGNFQLEHHRGGIGRRDGIDHVVLAACRRDHLWIEQCD